jgi:hypothetical protein
MKAPTQTLVFTIALLFLAASCNGARNKKTTNPTNTQAVTVTQADSIEVQIDNDSLYAHFKSYFPDLVLGEEPRGEGKPIPPELAKRFLPDDYYNPRAISKISGYKGNLDLFVVKHEENDDIPDSDRDFFFADGKFSLLSLRPDGQEISQEYSYEEPHLSSHSSYSFRAKILGQGAGVEYRSLFDRDTTIVTNSWVKEWASLFNDTVTSVEHQEYRWTVNYVNGKKVALEIFSWELSSLFYDRNWLNAQDWDYLQREEYSDLYPKAEAPLNLTRYRDFGDYSPPALYFHVETIDGELVPVFVSSIGDTPVDRYVVGSADNATSLPADIPTAADIAEMREPDEPKKCPIVIKTSDGDLWLLPDGKLRLSDSVQPDDRADGRLGQRDSDYPFE